MLTRVKSLLLGLALVAPAFLTLVAVAPDARAEGVSVIVGAFSYHPKPRPTGTNWNERNPMLGVEYRASSEWGVAVARFKNSEGAWSNSGVAHYTPLGKGNVYAGAMLGLVDGYATHKEKTCPEGWGRNYDTSRSKVSILGALTLEYRGPTGVQINYSPRTSKSFEVYSVAMKFQIGV